MSPVKAFFSVATSVSSSAATFFRTRVAGAPAPSPGCGVAAPCGQPLAIQR